jgi:uncharacterized protein
MALGGLIEDELILALPFAPRHEDCRPAGAGDSAESDSPFAALRGLIRNRH